MVMEIKQETLEELKKNASFLAIGIWPNIIPETNIPPLAIGRGQEVIIIITPISRPIEVLKP